MSNQNFLLIDIITNYPRSIDIPTIGETLMVWLEQLLLTQRLIAPDVETAVGGLSGVNKALSLLREGTVTGKRLVVPLEQRTAVVV
jgi:hypothetical protein